MSPFQMYLRKLRECASVQRKRAIIIKKGKKNDRIKYPDGVPESVAKRRIQQGPKFKSSSHMLKIVCSFSSSPGLSEGTFVKLVISNTGNKYVLANGRRLDFSVSYFDSFFMGNKGNFSDLIVQTNSFFARFC